MDSSTAYISEQWFRFLIENKDQFEKEGKSIETQIEESRSRPAYDVCFFIFRFNFYHIRIQIHWSDQRIGSMTRVFVPLQTGSSIYSWHWAIAVLDLRSGVIW